MLLGVLGVCAACTTISPAATVPGSASVPAFTAGPGASGLPSAEVPTLPAASLVPASISPTAEPVEQPTPTPSPTTAPPKTPKPTKKPTPTPSPTASPIAGDIEVAFEQSSIPDPFYVETDYTIRVYISALGTTDLPNVHVKLVAKDEGVSYKFDTGPIAITDSYSHDLTVNLPAMGPSALILTASMPDGYADTNKANNTKTVDISVQPKP